MPLLLRPSPPIPRPRSSHTSAQKLIFSVVVFTSYLWISPYFQGFGKSIKHTPINVWGAPSLYNNSGLSAHLSARFEHLNLRFEHLSLHLSLRFECAGQFRTGFRCSDWETPHLIWAGQRMQDSQVWPTMGLCIAQCRCIAQCKSNVSSIPQMYRKPKI